MNVTVKLLSSDTKEYELLEFRLYNDSIFIGNLVVRYLTKEIYDKNYPHPLLYFLRGNRTQVTITDIEQGNNLKILNELKAGTLGPDMIEFDELTEEELALYVDYLLKKDIYRNVQAELEHFLNYADAQSVSIIDCYRGQLHSEKLYFFASNYLNENYRINLYRSRKLQADGHRMWDKFINNGWTAQDNLNRIYFSKAN